MNAAMIFRLWHSDLDNDELRKKLGVSRPQFYHLRRKYGLPSRGDKKEPRGRRPGDPTHDEIRERCLAIQGKWSESERIRRIVGEKPRPVTARAYRYDGRTGLFSVDT